MYWPKEGSETYGNIQVKLLQEVVMATYTLRTFVAKNLKLKKRSDGERTVYQYHYTNWPDHGVPDHPLPVLSFIRKSASANPPGAGPIICHCSAGCGRSGTYIVIDAMLKQIRLRRSVNVVDFLKHIRNQRNYLVQTEEQYIFIHDALVEAIESGETEIASNFIAKYIQLLQTAPTVQPVGNGSLILSQKNSSYSIANGLHSPAVVGQQQSLSISPEGNQIMNGSNNLLLANPMYGNTNTNGRNLGQGQWSLLERQYRLVASFKAKDFNVVSALKPCNKNKNRTLNLIPLEAHRVHITAKPGQEGSDYINATFLMGFNHLREFIVTQHPVNETFSDFWQMVYDHNSQTIVLLTQMNDLKEYPQFWPQKEDEVDYGSFKVKLTQESTIMKAEDGGLVIARDFIMRSNQDDYELQTRVIHCPGWPECCSPLSGVFDLIQIVQNATHQQASQQRMHDGNAKTTTVTIGQEHEPQNGGPIIVVDKFGGTEAATFAVLTTLFKQINFEDAVDVYMYAKLAHLRRPGIWSSQDDYLFLYRAVENYASRMANNTLNTQLANSSPLTNPYHGQTMTLDRHKHRSSNSLRTSTMHRRSHNISHQNQTIQVPIDDPANKSPGGKLKATEKSKTPQLMSDHLVGDTHIGAPPITNLTHPSNAAIMIQRNAVTQQLKASLQNSNNNNNSPYNSAVSIGSNLHQHLLTSNGRTISSNQTQPVNHYLYPMS